MLLLLTSCGEENKSNHISEEMNVFKYYLESEKNSAGEVISFKVISGNQQHINEDHLIIPLDEIKLGNYQLYVDGFLRETINAYENGWKKITYEYQSGNIEKTSIYDYETKSGVYKGFENKTLVFIDSFTSNNSFKYYLNEDSEINFISTPFGDKRFMEDNSVVIRKYYDQAYTNEFCQTFDSNGVLKERLFLFDAGMSRKRSNYFRKEEINPNGDLIITTGGQVDSSGDFSTQYYQGWYSFYSISGILNILYEKNEILEFTITKFGEDSDNGIDTVQFLEKNANHISIND
jgi:hypothetical protein